MTMRLRKPRKLGEVWESWLRHEGLVWEWTAATWRYFRGVVLPCLSLEFIVALVLLVLVLAVLVVLVVLAVLASEGSERLRREMMAAAPLGVSTLVEAMAASIPCVPL